MKTVAFNHRSAFTLVEIMIVVAIIGILAAIALPNFVTSRETAIKNTCLANRGQMEGALARAALETNASTSNLSAAGIKAIVEPDYIKHAPVCPSGVYSTDASGNVLCSMHSSSSSGGSRGGGFNQGGSCPYVYVWDGSGYIKDNDILPAATTSGLGEHVDYYQFLKAPVLKDGKIYLRIVEELAEVSYLDKINLIMVDHPLDTQVAPDPQGNIHTIQNPILPVLATDNCQKDVTARLKSRDNDFYEASQGGWVIVNFGRVKSKNGFRLILSTDPPPPPAASSCLSIHVQILNNNKWYDVNVVHPHERWDIWAVDLGRAPFKEDVDVKIRLYATTTHKIDYAALDVSEQQPITKTELPIAVIRGSLDSDSLRNIFISDNKYAVMKKGDYIELGFPIYSQATASRDFILVSEGYYMPAVNVKAIVNK